MIKNMVFVLLGLFGGIWLVWPGISTKNGWVCTKDIVFNSEKEATDSQSFIEDLTRRLRISSAVSPKTLLSRKHLGPMDKFRIVGDACFR